jgi:methionine-gamma-lyase
MKFDTLAIHGGEEEKKPANSLNNPIFMTSTFTFDNLDHAKRTFSFKCDDYVYTRGNNPTLRVLERKMAQLETGVDGVAFASGMAAITSSLFALLKPGDELLAHRVLYGSSYNVVKEVLPAYQVKTKLIDLTDQQQLKENITNRTKAIFFETPSNPDLGIIDIEGVTVIARESGVKVVVDNTFATPYFQRPLERGADVVVHSATKYLNGHGDVLGGIAVATDQEYIHNLKFGYLTEFGGVLSPFNAWLILRGLKTLGLRMRQHEENARQVASFLNAHPGIKKVYYPGLRDSRNHDLASKQMKGYGAIISFEPVGGIEKAREIVESLKMVKLAVSLGDAETLIEYPFAMTHRNYTEEELQKLGLTPDMLRLSIGLEDVGDIIADLEQALG